MNDAEKQFVLLKIYQTLEKAVVELDLKDPVTKNIVLGSLLDFLLLQFEDLLLRKDEELDAIIDVLKDLLLRKGAELQAVIDEIKFQHNERITKGEQK